MNLLYPEVSAAVFASLFYDSMLLVGIPKNKPKPFCLKASWCFPQIWLIATEAMPSPSERGIHSFTHGSWLFATSTVLQAIHFGPKHYSFLLIPYKWLDFIYFYKRFLGLSILILTWRIWFFHEVFIVFSFTWCCGFLLCRKQIFRLLKHVTEWKKIPVLGSVKSIRRRQWKIK